MDAVGAYTADRAAALSGVPKSTVHRWARQDVLVPSVSTSKIMLWSYADLMGLRVIYWLRQRKTTKPGVDIPRTSLPTVRRALKELRAFNLSLVENNRSTIVVDLAGKIHVKQGERVVDLEGQAVGESLLDLIAPFTTEEGTRGPDLLAPRRDLRIVPGKLSGSPHVINTRLETRAIAALSKDGYDVPTIHRLYPYVSGLQIEQAIDLEQQLDANLRKHAA